MSRERAEHFLIVSKLVSGEGIIKARGKKFP